MSLPLVLITGATGYLGAHVLQQVQEAGYPVRITARPAKVEAAKKLHGDKVDVVPIADIVDGDFTEAFKGVGALIHTAAPLAGRQEAEGMLNSAVKGALNVISQAVNAGVKKIVITSSWGTANDLDRPERTYTDYVFSEKDWNPATREQVLDGKHHSLWVYCGAKTISEQEVWKYADEHPEVDITSINPPYLYGPLTAGTKVAKADLGQYSTPGMFHQKVLQDPNSGKQLEFPQFPSPVTVDVRDVAKAHVLALTSPPSSKVGQKRLLIGGPNWSYRDAVQLLEKERPELAKAGRLAGLGETKRRTITTIDSTRLKKVLGFKDFIPWEKTILDMTDNLLEIEKSWE
ncbi:hypothetical protein EW145_g3401 [Phellinidium pouzarii]|uniref:NAD-dependent epimerase/dehydratase domain-containing protein n=1 Tax=Phellinidium pouzarii TaxID=167371 RepID=A0A4V3XCW0_9AGAM|nr:hypothetical protein EW145_g3401 [Phellinidium pouzarii]